MRNRIAWLFGSVAILVLATGAFAQEKAACPSCSAGKAVTEAKKVSATLAKEASDTSGKKACATTLAKNTSAVVGKKACPVALAKNASDVVGKKACPATLAKNVSATAGKKACAACSSGEACTGCAAKKVSAAASKSTCSTCAAGEACTACASKKVNATLAKKTSATAGKKACATCASGEACAACAAKKVTASAKTTDGKKKPEEVKWLTDFAKAQKTAAQKKRNILVNFSGSDWCGWCIKLDDEVLSKKAFEDYARGQIVLFTADFPRRTPQDAKIKEQNKKLAEKYKIKGFPTVLLLNPEGKVLAQTGYKKGGPEVYVKHLTKLFEDAKKKEEAAKKKALAQAKNTK